MGKTIKNLIDWIKYLQTLLPILAAIYLIGWVAKICAPNAYELINTILGFLPEAFDNWIYASIKIGDETYSLGYVLCAVSLVLINYILLRLTPLLNDICEQVEEFELKKRYEKELKLEEEQKLLEQPISSFYALFEIKLKHFGITGTDTDLDVLKIEYSKMIAKKLHDKYRGLRFLSAGENKVFFLSENFSLFDSVVPDIVKLYNVILELDKKKFIKTDLLLSFYADNKTGNANEALRILSKINQLNYFNKVMVTQGVEERYSENTDKNFDFISYGASTLPVLGNDKDMEIGLFQIRMKDKYDY